MATRNGFGQTKAGTNDSTTVFWICQPNLRRFRRLCELFLSAGSHRLYVGDLRVVTLTAKSNRPKIGIPKAKMSVLVLAALAPAQNLSAFCSGYK